MSDRPHPTLPEHPIDPEPYYGPDGHLYFRQRDPCAEPPPMQCPKGAAKLSGINRRELGRILGRGFVSILCDWRFYALVALLFCLDVFIRHMSHG